MNELAEEIRVFIVDCGAELLAAVLLTVLVRGLKLLKQAVLENIKDTSVRQAVRYVEQIFKGVSSSEKYGEALKAVSEKLTKMGIKTNEAELKIKIEAYVNEFFAHDENDYEKEFAAFEVGE